MIPYSLHYKSEDNILLLVLTAALKFLHLNIKYCWMGQNSFAFWLIPYCGNGIWCSHGLLMGKGAFVWKVGATLIRPPARPALRGEFLGGLSGLPDPLSLTYKQERSRSLCNYCQGSLCTPSGLQPHPPYRFTLFRLFSEQWEADWFSLPGPRQKLLKDLE